MYMCESESDRKSERDAETTQGPSRDNELIS